jgi:GNAT superfamily N-acetyltransferase
MNVPHPERAGSPPERERIEEISVSSPEVERLLVAFRNEMRERYAGIETAGRGEPVTPDGLEPPSGRFLGVWVGDRLVACGGIRVLEPGTAEIKRMYVAESARGQGVGRDLLAALESAARSLGCDRVRLDTGEYQPEAQALYRSAGYREIPAYNDMPPGTFWAERSLTKGTGLTLSRK